MQRRLLLSLVLGAAAISLVWAGRQAGPALTSWWTQAGKLRVLAIGINEYRRGGIGSIAFGVADAQAIAQSFEMAGRTAAFHGVETTTLFNEQATLSSVTNALHGLAERSSPDDVIVIYFGGQGRPAPSSTQTVPEYLFAVSDTAWTDDAHIERALSSIELSQLMRQIPARFQIAILDSAGSKSALDALRGAMNADKRFSLESAGRRYALFGLQGMSFENTALGHGLLTAAILQGMAGEADGGREGKITAGGLEGYLTWKVPALVEKNSPSGYGEIEFASYSTLRELPLSVTAKPAAVNRGEEAASDKESAATRGVTVAKAPAEAKPGDPGKDYALILAGDAYDHLKKLSNPRFDADTLEQELKQNYGYQVWRRDNGTKDQISDELDNLNARTFGEKDRLLVYIAGHGDVSAVGNVGFLAGRDSLEPPQDPHHSSYLALSVLKEQLDSVGAGHVLLVLDTCYSGTFDHAIANSGSREAGTISKRQLIERLGEGRSRLYLASGGRREVSDGEPGRHSPFARQFLNILRGYGGDRGLVDMEEIEAKMSVLSTRPFAGHFYPNEVSGDFVFIAANDAHRVSDKSLQ